MTAQRPTPPQDRYRAAHVNQHPTNDLRAVASTQQYHEDTYRRPSSHSEAQSSRESRYERSTNSTPYHGRECILGGAEDFAGTDMRQDLHTCVLAPTSVRHVLTQDQTAK
jgi:hypothetical protein